MHVSSVNEHYLEAALFEDFVEWNPVDSGRFHRHGLNPTLSKPVRQLVQVAGESAELAYRFAVAVGGDSREMAVLSAVDPGRVGLNAFE